MPVQSIPYSETDLGLSRIVKAVIEDGVVIVDNVLSSDEVLECRQGLHDDLRQNLGVEVESLETTAYLMEKFQTHPSGGLPLHFSKWRMKHCCFNERVLKVTRALWEATYAQGDPAVGVETDSMESLDRESNINCNATEKKVRSLDLASQCKNPTNLPSNRLDTDGRPLWGTPYGKFLRDNDTGQLTAFPYIDSLNFRLPTTLASYNKKNGRRVQFQRHIAAHADVNFWNMYGGKKGRTRWRPFQAFLALTDNKKSDKEDYMSGGLEVVSGFHREASSFFKNIPEGYGQSNEQFEYNREFCGGVKMAETNDTDNGKNQNKTFQSIRTRFERLNYPAGSFVIWDWRIPHRQQERNDGLEAREVVYTSFLPDINVASKFTLEPSETENFRSSFTRINKNYAEKQLSNYVDGTFPPDFVSGSLNKKWNGKVPGWRMEDVKELLGPVLNINGAVTVDFEDVNFHTDIQKFYRFLMGMR